MPSRSLLFCTVTGVDFPECLWLRPFPSLFHLRSFSWRCEEMTLRTFCMQNVCPSLSIHRRVQYHAKCLHLHQVQPNSYLLSSYPANLISAAAAAAPWSSLKPVNKIYQHANQKCWYGIASWRQLHLFPLLWTDQVVTLKAACSLSRSACSRSSHLQYGGNKSYLSNILKDGHKLIDVKYFKTLEGILYMLSKKKTTG